MRLLKLGARGELSLTQTFSDEGVPPYAIVSHTWGEDKDEVTFNDLQNGSGKSKAGYTKLQFCGGQAQRDGLQYLWVDTCCIDYANPAELSEAVSSMFGWYREAVKCYVYLSDVSAHKRDSNGETEQTWEPAFRNSRWFKRGWPLQELLAPASVEFFTREGKLLGEKKGLGGLIHEITGIPLAALRGAPLSNFSVEERLRWAAKRTTRRIEDKAYCLLGIFSVSMTTLYGEGENAFIRLKKEIYNASRNRFDKFSNDQKLLAIEPPDYHPLADLGFRLLILEPGVIGTHLTGYIEEFNLSNPPVYHALSYVWGHEPMIQSVTINGKTKLIQPNLYHALQRIRLSVGPYRIWVDSLCINQLNDSEKNMQVRLMATIYGRASGVIIWLGEEDSSSKTAMQFVCQIILSNFRWDGSWWDQYEFIALAQILERPWFRRCWVLQEAAVSKNSTIYCGDRQIHIDQFTMAIDLVRAKLDTTPPSVSRTINMVRTGILSKFYASPAVRFLDIIEGAFGKSTSGEILDRRMSLETLVNLGTFSETTDPRDTIYALLNLANDIALLSHPDQSDTIVPDYRKAVLDVYVDFILHCSCHSGNLDIICRPWAPVPCSTVFATSKDEKIDHYSQTYPSWIASRDNLPFGNPYWRLNHRLNGNPLVGGTQKRAYNAHHGSKPTISFGRTKDGSCDGSLYARGFVLGEIAKRSTRMASAIITKDCLNILGTISRKSHSSLIDVPDTIWRTLCADRDKKGEPAPRVYRAAMAQLLEISSGTSQVCGSTHFLDDMSSIDTEELLDTEISDVIKNFLIVIRDVVWNRRTFCSKIKESTDEPLVGLVPQNARIGDQLCILYGCSVPLLLREISSLNDEHCWQLIGDAYVHGIMNGEAISCVSSEILQSRDVVFKIL